MDQAVQHVTGQVLDIDEKSIVEIIVHISEDLDDGQRGSLVAALKDSKGIADAEFCPLRSHLLLVRYDRSIFSSQDVLGDVSSKNLNARLIGPI